MSVHLWTAVEIKKDNNWELQCEVKKDGWFYDFHNKMDCFDDCIHQYAMYAICFGIILDHKLGEHNLKCLSFNGGDRLFEFPNDCDENTKLFFSEQDYGYTTYVYLDELLNIDYNEEFQYDSDVEPLKQILGKHYFKELNRLKRFVKNPKDMRIFVGHD